MANTNVSFKHISGDVFRKKHEDNDYGIELGALYIVFANPNISFTLDDYSKGEYTEGDFPMMGTNILPRTLTPESIEVSAGQIWVKKSIPVNPKYYTNASEPQWFLCASGVSSTSSIDPDVIEQKLSVYNHVLSLEKK